MQHTQGQRSLFWPLVLIAIGGLWLLNEFNIISGANIAMLLRLWPLMLIVIGVELLLRGRYPQLSTYLGIGAVVLMVALVLVGPSLGWVGSRTLQSGSYAAPLENAQSAQVQIGAGVADITVSPLSGSDNLFEASIAYVGTVEFFVRGEASRFVSLQQTESTSTNMGFGDFFDWDDEGQDLAWNIGIATGVPLDLEVNAGVGSTELNLTDLTLRGLNVNAGVGAVNVLLPASDAAYSANLNGGTGQMDVTIPENTAVEVRVSGGVGEVEIDVPEGAAVRIEAQTGLGGVNVPGGYTRVSGRDNNGTWQSPDYRTDARQIRIVYQGGVGSLNVR
ncbi:MAG: hypothetical protein HXY40_18510 [Chloroflexi bacterium]|nr:hypothetical protein [Chloroflexota bacterium]